MSSADPPPRVRVTLPDRQELIGYLYERRQWPLAGWMYQVGLGVWANNGVTESVEPQEYRVWLTPGEQVHRVEGVSYEKVPTYALPWQDGQETPTDRWAWKIQRLPLREGQSGKVVVHTADCPEAPAGQPEVSLFDALDVLRGTTGAFPCTECDAKVALDPLLKE